jgi:hypothetical protein
MIGTLLHMYELVSDSELQVTERISDEMTKEN